jgi:hypothetical protein
VTILTATASLWPSRAACFSAAVFIGASGATNVLNGWQKGIDLPTSLVWSGVAGAVAVIFPLSWPPLANFAKLFRDGQADIDEVRRWTPLPETADESCEVARRLAVPDSEILLGARATEATLKVMSEKGRLADYAILHFATHGALTGQVERLARAVRFRTELAP